MGNAVIVVDMLRGFLEDGNPLYCGDQVRHIIPHVQRLLQNELTNGSKIFYLCDNHKPDDLEFKTFPPHCISGTTEAEIIPELSLYPGEVIPKSRFSGFFNTQLEKKLKALQPNKVIVCGVCTDICVLHTVSDARNHDYEVEVPVDCVASFNEKAHRFAIEHMGNILGAKIIISESTREPKFNATLFDPSDSVLSGETADVYFAHTIEILKKEGINPMATMEVFPRRAGILCGIKEVRALFERVLPADNREVWALSEGEAFEEKEVVLRITAPYQSYGLYETAYLGILAHSSGWATAARECVDAASRIPVISFGARHVHPSVAGVMDYAAIIGGCNGCSSVVGAKLAGIKPSGTMPHTLILIIGDTARATILYDKHMPAGMPRISLVDTFRDEPEESVLVAHALKEKLEGVRLDTPRELGGVTADLVKETRRQLDIAGYKEVKIFVSGGLTPQRIYLFRDNNAPVDAFGVGSYVSNAPPIDFTADIHKIDKKPVSKRGRIKGITANPKLKRII